MNPEAEMTRVSIDQSNGPLVIEFGAAWCNHCQAAQTVIAAALVHYPNVKHIKIEDGKGKLLGRSYKVKLWPTLVFIKNGAEITKLVRPNNSQLVADALKTITAIHQ